MKLGNKVEVVENKKQHTFGQVAVGAIFMYEEDIYVKVGEGIREKFYNSWKLGGIGSGGRDFVNSCEVAVASKVVVEFD